MKKGCFIKIIIILTILTAAIVYIVQNHFDELILKPGKKALAEMYIEEFDDKAVFIAESPEKDSLRQIVRSLVLSKMEKEKNISNESLKDFFDSISHTLNDSIITLSELEEINKIAGLQNER